MSTAKERVRRMKLKRKKRKPFLTTKTETVAVTNSVPHKGEKRKRKTTKVKIGKARYTKTVDTPIEKNPRSNLVKKTVTKFETPNKTKMKDKRIKRDESGLYEETRKSGYGVVFREGVPKKPTDKLKKQYRNVISDIKMKYKRKKRKKGKK
tara:strand:+ start:693 stop:1145 length:453 start_codon:yes stop_codon:yes gene_type:complete